MEVDFETWYISLVQYVLIVNKKILYIRLGRVSEPFNFDAAPAPTLKLIYQFLFIIEFDKIK